MMLTQEGDLLSFVTSSGTYREDVFQRDVLLLQAYYQDRGYINVKVERPQVRAVARQALAVHHHPHRRGAAATRSARSTSRATCWTTKPKVLSRLRAKSGETFSRSKLGQDIQDLTEYYKDKGYAYVNIIPQTDVDEKTRIVDVTFEIQKGSEVYFDRINIRGNTKTRDKVIRREMRVVEGELYNSTRLAAVQAPRHRARLLRAGRRLRQARRQRRQDGGQHRGHRAADRHLPDRRRLLLGRELHRPGADLAEQPVRPRPVAVPAGAAVGLRQLFLLSFEEPYFLDTNWTFGFDLFNQFQYYPSFNRTSSGGSLTWGYLLVDDVRLFLSYKLEDVGVSTSGPLPLPLGRPAHAVPGRHPGQPAAPGPDLVVPALAVLRHPRQPPVPDQRLVQRRLGRVRRAGLPARRTQFTRYDATVRYFYPLWGPFVLRTRATFGLVTSRDPQGVPIFERYFVGGIYDVRGFRPYSLGPRIRAPQRADPRRRPGRRRPSAATCR